MGDMMKKLLFYSKKMFFLLIYLFIVSIISSLFYLYTNMSYNTNCLILFILTVIGLGIINFLNGQKASTKGYLEGLKLGSITVGIFFLISLLTKDFLSLSKIIYYLILILISTIAAALGINFKKDTNLKR